MFCLSDVQMMKVVFKVQEAIKRKDHRCQLCPFKTHRPDYRIISKNSILLYFLLKIQEKLQNAGQEEHMINIAYCLVCNPF